MARFDDLYERFRKKRKEKGTGYSGAEPFHSARNAVTVTPEASEYTGTGRFAGILEKARKNGVSFSGVDENYIQSFMQDAQSFVKKSQKESQSLTWAGATSQEQYDNRVKTMQDLGTRADAVRVYLNANKGKINPEWYDYMSGFLRDFDSDTQSIFETFHGAKGYYSQWDSQEAYDFYDAHSTPEKRQQWYAGLETQREKLEVEKEKETAAWQKIGEEIENPYEYWEKEEVYNSKIKSIQEQIDKIDTERRQYERGDYGSKTKDDIYFLSKNADYATLSQRRDLGNATKADYDKWYYEAEGGYILEDETMQTLYHKEEGSIPEKDKSTFQINDPLGFYLQAVDADKRNEQIYVSHNGGAREYDWVMEKGESGKWELLDEDETNAYYYKLNKEGEEAALAFLDSLKPELEKRKAENVAKTTEEFYKNADLIGKIILNTATVPANLVGGTIGLANNAKNLIQGKEIDPYSGANALNRFSNNIRGTTAQELDELMPGVKLPGIDFTVGDLYQTVMSRADSLAAMGIGGKLGGVLLAAGAAENEMTRLYEQGASVKQMIWGAATAGAAELVFESIGIDKLLSIKDGKHAHSLVMNILSQGGAEALEEGATEIANILSNAAIMGSQSDWNKLVADNNGDKKAAFLEKVRDVAKAGFGGFLSGAMGGAAMTRDGKTQEDIKEDIDRMTPMDAEWTLEKQPETRVEEIRKTTNAVSKPIASYSAEKQNNILAFLQSVDEGVKKFVEDVKSGDLSFKRQKISDVGERQAKDIKELLGVDATGYTNDINTNGIQHILIRHGENGKQDHSMAATEDIARIGWVLENYDKAELANEDGKRGKSKEFLDKNGLPANQIKFSKKIDGYYYVVEAAFENKHKKLWVQSAYLSKKEDVTQTPDADKTANHGKNAQSEFASPSSKTIINHNGEYVNPEIEGVMLPTKEDIARMEAGEGVQGAQEPGQEAQAPEEMGFPTREDVAQMEAGKGVRGDQEPGQEAQAPEGIGFPTREDVAQMEAREEPRSRVEEVGLPMPESREDQNAKSRERIRRAEEILGDKGSYMSKNAAELYEELSELKKGVKASSRLGYILDHGYEWRSIKTALLNIRDNPGEVVNPNSQAEALIREMLGREYDDTVEDLSRPDEVTNQYAEKLWNIKTEIANNQRLREENMADYQEEIDRLQEMYDGKANKTTKAANDILRRIERVTRMKNTVDGDYTRRIERLQERLDKMDTDVYRRAQQRRSKQAQYEREVAELIGDTSTWKDKKLGVSYWINTLRRNLRDVVRDENGKRDIEKAYAIYDYLQGQYNHDEAGRKRETAKIKNPYAELEITKEEDAYIQMLGELRHNPSTELSLEVVEEYYEKHKKHIDKAKVDKAIEMSRKTYDELFARLNKRLREQGMKEIPYRKGYFPHFTEDAQGPIAKFLNWKTKNNEIPTDIAGLTEGFNPERSWQSFNKERTGDTTTYSFLRGMDTYVQGALDWIYHIEDIQRRRALENYIRYVHSDEGIRARIDEIKANEEYDADEAQQMIDAVLAEAKNPLGNFVQDLRTGTNILAGKKNTLDRGVESATNRKIYSVMTNLSNRVSANMVAGSVSSAMTNFIPITQSWGQVSPVSSLRAMLDTIRNAVSDDGTVNKSDFLTNRLRNPDNLYKGTWDKISDKVGWLMEAVDNFTSQTVWRSKYMENIAAGMSEAEAIKNADQFAENVLAGRSRGNMPTAFDAKNPIAKIATAFQLEVANQYGYILKDMPQDMKKETTGKLVKGYATMFLGAYLYNMAFSALTGRDSALDPIGIIEQLIRGLTDEEEEPKDAVTDFLENVLQEVPFVGGLMGGGRVPLSSAMPYDSVWGMVEGLTQDIGSGDWKSVWEELSNPLYYLVSPMGGGQIRKTAQGLGMYFNEVPGSYTYDENGEPQLRFPVEEGIAPWLQAALFGKWSGQNAQQYLEEGRKPLSAKQTREFFESGMTIQEYWDYRDEMTKLKKQDEKLALINGMDITEDQKRVLKRYLFDEEKYAEENPEKYAFLEEEGIGYLGWKELPDDAKDAWDWAFKHQDEYRHYKENGVMPGDYTTYQVPMLEFKNEADQAYEWEYNYPDKAVMGDVFADGVVEYRKYIKAMSEMKSDKDADGKTVAGSRKQKVTDYINSLDIDYGEKIILYVTEFNSTASRDMYGNEIVEYLNGRNDLSEKQIREILKQLGFEVAEDGRVTWE